MRLLSAIGFVGVGATLHYGFHATWYFSAMPAFLVFCLLFLGLGSLLSPVELDDYLERRKRVKPGEPWGGDTPL